VAHWTSRLVGTRPHGRELEWLSPDAERIRSALGDGAVNWAIEVGERIATKITSEIPPLGEGRPHFNALRRATTSTTMRALALAAGLVGSGASLSSVEEVEIAQDFARRGLELNDLLRAIRVGYAVLAAALLDAATQMAPQADTSAELRRISVLLFEVLDDFTTVAATAFLDEQNTWTASVAAARFDLVKNIVDGHPVDPDHAERLLAYPLSGTHVAVIAWSATPGGVSGHDLRTVVDPVLRHWWAPSATLVIPVGSHTIWAWGASAGSGRAGLASGARAELPKFDGVNIVTGECGHGIEGFRRSHLEAGAVERLVRLRPEHAQITTAHEDVDLEVLLLSDPEAARQFVTRHLGPLAADDPRMAELRCTLRRYLDTARSISKVAAEEHISRNTVTYRVQQAFSLCGHTDGAPTTKLRAALLAREWLDNSTTPL
jgi:DNA-binding PucR family transcriptional regulator